jgi:hypothetical protein
MLAPMAEEPSQCFLSAPLAQPIAHHWSYISNYLPKTTHLVAQNEAMEKKSTNGKATLYSQWHSVPTGGISFANGHGGTSCFLNNLHLLNQ